MSCGMPIALKKIVFLQTDFEGLLELGAWACEDKVLLNFVAVNKFGSTGFTLVTAYEVNVYGG